MTRKSYAILQRDLLACQQVIGDLKLDRRYNAVRREAAAFELAHLTATPRSLVLLDFAPPAHNGSIRRALHARGHDTLSIIHWQDAQFVIVLGAPSQDFIDRLYPILKNEGLTAAVSGVPYSGDLERDIRIAQAFARAQKESPL